MVRPSQVPQATQTAPGENIPTPASNFGQRLNAGGSPGTAGAPTNTPVAARPALNVKDDSRPAAAMHLMSGGDPAQSLDATANSPTQIKPTNNIAGGPVPALGGKAVVKEGAGLIPGDEAAVQRVAAVLDAAYAGSPTFKQAVDTAPQIYDVVVGRGPSKDAVIGGIKEPNPVTFSGGVNTAMPSVYINLNFVDDVDKKIDAAGGRENILPGATQTVSRNYYFEHVVRHEAAHAAFGTQDGEVGTADKPGTVGPNQEKLFQMEKELGVNITDGPARYGGVAG